MAAEYVTAFPPYACCNVKRKAGARLARIEAASARAPCQDGAVGAPVSAHARGHQSFQRRRSEPARSPQPIRHPRHRLLRQVVYEGVREDKPADEQRIGGRHIPTRRKIGRRAVGRDPEDELDLGDIGGKSNAAAHGRQYGARGVRCQTVELLLSARCPSIAAVCRSSLASQSATGE